MRWLAVLVLGGCSFSPGVLPVDAQKSGTDIDAAIDGTMVSIDAPSDTMVQPPTKFVRRIDLDDTKITGGTHTDFPLLVSLQETWLRTKVNGGDVERTDAFDIFFSSDQAGTTRLAHEIEGYGPMSGVLVAWVKIPALTAESVLYLHYGDDTITTNQSNPPQVWTANYAAVVHMAGDGDSTGINTLSETAVSATGGQISIGGGFNGTTSVVAVGSLPAVDDIFATGGTIEGWFYATGFGEGGFGRMIDKGFASGYSLYVDNTNRPNTVTFVHGTTTGNGLAGWSIPSNAAILNTWHHVAVVYDRDLITNDPAIYLDGVATVVTEMDAPAGETVSDAAIDLNLGNDGAGVRTFAGVLDELRMSTVMRSAGWIATQYRNQAMPATFYTVSAPL